MIRSILIWVASWFIVRSPFKSRSHALRGLVNTLVSSLHSHLASNRVHPVRIRLLRIMKNLRWYLQRLTYDLKYNSRKWWLLKSEKSQIIHILLFLLKSHGSMILRIIQHQGCHVHKAVELSIIESNKKSKTFMNQMTLNKAFKFNRSKVMSWFFRNRNLTIITTIRAPSIHVSQ